MSNWEGIEVGDIVKCVDFRGSTGRYLEISGRDIEYKVVHIEEKTIRHYSLLRLTKPDGEFTPKVAYIDRFEIVRKGLKQIMDPDMTLDEIHQAQELMNG